MKRNVLVTAAERLTVADNLPVPFPRWTQWFCSIVFVVSESSLPSAVTLPNVSCKAYLRCFMRWGKSANVRQLQRNDTEWRWRLGERRRHGDAHRIHPLSSIAVRSIQTDGLLVSSIQRSLFLQCNEFWDARQLCLFTSGWETTN